MKTLWQFAELEQSYVLPGLSFLGRSGLLKGKVGITCPQCRANFEVVQSRIRLARLTLWAIAILAAVVFVASRGSHTAQTGDPVYLLGTYSILAIAFLALRRFMTPYLAEVRRPSDEKALSYPLKSAYIK
jgi:hypothetical protein